MYQFPAMKNDRQSFIAVQGRSIADACFAEYNEPNTES